MSNATTWSRAAPARLGVVSFLNSKPLIAGLATDPRVHCLFDVPAALPKRLAAGEVDAALVPIIDVIRAAGALHVISDACIGSDGETMTVRIFSQTPPDRITALAVDTDSHTSVALARVLWRELYGRDLAVQRIDARRADLTAETAVLLIGDKVVDPRRAGFAFEVDLGGAWRQHTGLPFVFAVWVARQPDAELGAVLDAARDRGVAQAAEIAAQQGPDLGWPPSLAERYLTRCLCFKLDERAVAGAERFAACCRELDLAPAGGPLPWPPQCTPASELTR